ncbi:ADP-ribosylation factor-related protein 1 [Hordeum vulgare]|nr:ADP-ribosylation factor-related protein 1 [Hordeum vulgare]
MRTSGWTRLSSAQGTVAVLLKWGSRGPVIVHSSHRHPATSLKPDNQTLAASSNSPATHLAAMGLWNYDRKGKHDHEAGSSSGHRRVSVKEEDASPLRCASAAAPFTIAPRPAGQRDRQYLSAEATWLRDEHDVRRASYFVGTVLGPWRAREVRGRTRVRGLTPTPSPSPCPSPPPPPRMMEEEEAQLMQCVMEDSMMTHDECQWPDLDHAMALSAAGDVAIPEQMEEEEVVAFPPDLVGASWSWSCAASEMAQEVVAVNWCPRRRGHLSGRPRHRRRCCRYLRASSPPPRTRDRRLTFGRRRHTSTSSATAMMTTPAANEDGDGHDIDSFFN